MSSGYKLNNLHYFVKVLVIENTFYVKKTISKILTEAGFFVLTASSSKEAINKIIKYSPDLITISSMLSDVSGLKFLSQYSDAFKEKKLKVMFVTNLDEKDEGKPVGEIPIDDYIFKPIDEDLLLSKVRKLFPSPF